MDLAVAGWILLALVLPLLLGALTLAVRRMAIRRPGGAVPCSMLLDGAARWRRGVVAYRSGQLFCYRSASLRPRPDAVFDRQSLKLAERHVLDAGISVVRFETGRPGQALWLEMSTDALTGLLAWVEAAQQRWLGEGVLDHPA
jgi:hypothetical protein